MADDKNLIPTLKSAGRFEANAPFDKVVLPSTYYTVEALRTIPEMQALKLNLYELLFAPVGVAEADYNAVLQRSQASGAVVVVLTNRFGPPVYVLSTYFKSFPLVDGVSYERMCLIVDLGPLPPTMKDALAQVQTHVKDYVLSVVGLESEVKIGTVPSIGYVSRQDADIFEQTRKNKITDGDNDIAKLKKAQADLIKAQAYIAVLEAQLGAQQQVVPTP